MLVLETDDSVQDCGQARICGSLTLRFLPDFLPVVTAFVEKRAKNIIDLSAVEEIDTSVFQLLAAMKKHAALEERRLKYVRHSAAVLELIDLYGVTGLFRDKITISKQDRERGAFAYGIQPQEFFR